MRTGATGDAIYNGAQDNATGVAGLIEMAEAYMTAPAPRRDVYFVATTAEESGLLGSAFLVAHPPMAIPRFVADVALFLASELSRGITGQVIDVGGPQVSTYDMKRSPPAVPTQGHFTPQELQRRMSEIIGGGQEG
jgi:putative aminopeptidase FrvX